MLKPNNPDNKLLSNRKCKCGRRIVVAKIDYDLKTFLCSTCKTLGVKESRRMFLQIGANLDQTIFKTNEKEVKNE